MATDLFCRNTTFLHESVTESHIVPVLEKRQVVPLMLVGFGGLSTMLAIIHHLIRKYVYKDSHNLDTVFDAGGRVSFGLTAVTVTSQLLWPADFLLQGTLMAKMGLGGTLFYNIAVVMSILIFPLLSLTIKSRAPGAKTFLQIVYTRYGTSAHVVFCIIALLANDTVLMALILSAKAAMDVLVKDISDELLVLIIAFLFGSYCLLGGLGTTFYISYFTTAFTIVGTLVFVMITRYNYNADQFMSPERLYTAMSCLNTTNGNSYVTFRSRSGVIYGVITLLMSVSLSVWDQANWQSRIAAKPTEGVIGFFIAAYVWFAIPLTMSMAAASVYLSSSYQNGTYLLTAKDIDAGFISPYVMQSIMGESGAFLLLSILTWSLMSTGSGEIMAISSILVYDIYKVYIYPFRRDGSASKCLFCGKDRLFESDSHEKCNCLPASSCQACALDTKKREKAAKQDVVYECNIHGRYRRYEDRLLHKKTWCMLWVTLFILPYLLLIIHSGMDLNWVMFVLLGSMSSFLPPIVLTLVWAKCTSHGILAGSIGGGISYFAGLFLIAELAYEDGLQNFFGQYKSGLQFTRRNNIRICS